MKQPVGVILAGGLSTRMGGGDKGLLLIGGQSLLARVMDRFEPQVAALALNANGDVRRFADLGLPVLEDSVPDYPGPLAGILAGMDWAASLGATHVVTVSADTPFLPEDLVPRLLLASEGGAEVALAASQDGDRLRRHPTIGLWSAAVREDLRDALAKGERRVGKWAESRGAALAPFHNDRLDPFFNINTPEDLAHAQALLSQTPL